jgi:glutathione S-transferase
LHDARWARLNTTDSCSIVRLCFCFATTDQYHTGYLVEVDPYMKPRELLDVSSKGLVPALKLNNYDPPRAVNESTVIMDYLEECVFAPDSNCSP